MTKEGKQCMSFFPPVLFHMWLWWVGLHSLVESLYTFTVSSLVFIRIQACYMRLYGGIMQWSDHFSVAKYQQFVYFKLPKHVIFVVFKMHKYLIAKTMVLNYFNDFLKPLKIFRILKRANSWYFGPSIQDVNNLLEGKD